MSLYQFWSASSTPVHLSASPRTCAERLEMRQRRFLAAALLEGCIACDHSTSEWTQIHHQFSGMHESDMEGGLFACEKWLWVVLSFASWPPFGSQDSRLVRRVDRRASCVTTANLPLGPKQAHQTDYLEPPRYLFPTAVVLPPVGGVWRLLPLSSSLLSSHFVQT